jgi:nucleoside-diphosphate-sugar epimerase
LDKVILVSGANGFIGRNLIEFLADDSSFRIIGVDLQSHYTPLQKEPGPDFRYVQADVSEQDSMERLRQNGPLAAIVHLAGVTSQAEDSQTVARVFEANVKSTLLMIELAKADGAYFVFPSTGLVYGNAAGPFSEDMEPAPKDFYAFSKHLAEQIILRCNERTKMPFAILRAAVVYGPGQAGSMLIPSVIEALVAGRDFHMTPGEQKRDFLYVDDFVKAVDVCIRSGRTGVYNVGTQRATRIIDAALLCQKLAGVTGKIKAGAIPYREGESWEYCLCIQKIRKELRWSPATGLEQGLRATIEWHRAAHPQSIPFHN